MTTVLNPFTSLSPMPSIDAPMLGSLMIGGAVSTVVGKNVRILLRGQKVRVYRNLNKPEFFSIMACTGECKGLVCGYARAVRVKDGSFIVSEKSRQRVLREKSRNVHAFVEGCLDDMAEFVQQLPLNDVLTVSYNPYKMGSFYDVHTEQPLPSTHIEVAVLQGSNVYMKTSQN